MEIKINKMFSAESIYTHDAEENSIKLTLEAGVAAKVDFYGADLTDADLTAAFRQECR